MVFVSNDLAWIIALVSEAVLFSLKKPAWHNVANTAIHCSKSNITILNYVALNILVQKYSRLRMPQFENHVYLGWSGSIQQKPS